MPLLLVLLGCGSTPPFNEGAEVIGAAPVPAEPPAPEDAGRGYRTLPGPVGLLHLEPFGEIVDEERVPARLTAIARPEPGAGKAPGGVAYRVAVEARGKSSSIFPKRSYNLEIQDESGDDRDAHLLGMGAEADWVLHGPYTDKTGIRNAFTYALARRMGQWAPATRFAELRIGLVYAGLYTVIEKPEIDDERVDLPEPSEVAGVATGGYLFKLEGGTDGGAGWKSERGTTYEFHDPGPDEITDVQRAALRAGVDRFEEGVRGGGDPARFVDVPSFVDFVIVQELSRNVDGYRRSTFLQLLPEEDGGLVRAGPVWDFDIAWGNADFCDGWNTEGLVWEAEDVCDDWRQIPRWWHALLGNAMFREALRCRWEELRGGVLADEALAGLIRELSHPLAEARARDDARWHTLGEAVWPNWYVGATWEEELGWLRSFATERAAWLDASLPGECEAAGAPEGDTAD